MAINLDKMKAAREERREEKAAGRRHGSDRREVLQLYSAINKLQFRLASAKADIHAQRRGIAQLLELVYFLSQHADDCGFPTGGRCTCIVGRKVRHIKARLRADLR